MEKETRSEFLGRMLGTIVIEIGHQRFNASQGRKIEETCLKTIQERIDEIQPKKADPKYKKARYGKKS